MYHISIAVSTNININKKKEMLLFPPLLIARRHRQGRRLCGFLLLVVVIASLTRATTTEALALLPHGSVRHGEDNNNPRRPRLARLLGGTVGLTTRILLGVNSAERLDVCVRASSNRQVAVRGQVDGVLLEGRNLQGPLCHLTQFRLQSSSSAVSWGQWPWVFSLTPVVLWKFRRTVLYLTLTGWLYPAFGKALRSRVSTLLRRYCNGQPWSLDYQIVMTEEDVQKSRLVRWVLGAVLRSIMLHSVVGTAAAAGDAWTQLLRDSDDNNNNPLKDVSSSSSSSNDDDDRTLRRLVGSSSAPSKTSTDGVNPPPPQQRQQRRPESKLTESLQATDFRLTNTTFDDAGRLVLEADAVWNNNNDDTNGSRFSYTLRVTPRRQRVMVVMDDDDENNNPRVPQQRREEQQLVFADPECRFRTGVWVGPLARWIPDVWLPVGPGVALPLLGKRHHAIHGIDFDNDDAERTSYRITGRLFVFQERPPSDAGARDDDDDSPPPRPLPFSARRALLLPPSSRRRREDKNDEE